MSKVQLIYQGEKNVEFVSNSFDTELEANRFKNWMQFIFTKLQKANVSSAEKFQVSMISDKSKKTSKTNSKSLPKTVIESGTFSDMIIHTYGKGYLLRPSENHPDWGDKYYHDGWWNQNQEAWFFKKEKLGDLLFQGAELQEEPKTKSTSSNKTESKKVTKPKSTPVRRRSKRISKNSTKNDNECNKCKKITWEKNLIQDLSLETYGKGYLLRPSKKHPDWGEKYYHEGWWNQKQKAWFYKKDNLPGFCKNMKC